MTRLASRLAAVAFVLLLVVAPVSTVLAPGASPVGTASAAPEGFVGIPDTNVVDDFPVGESSPLDAESLRGSVMASRDASSLQVVVTTPERSDEYVNGSRVSGSGDVALVFRDNQSHAGRDVAVPADAVRQTVGHVPELVHGVHEDGTHWSSPVEARNGLLIFHIPKFSSNTVTFEGEVTVTADPAQDGSKSTYDVGNPDAVGDFQINLTGVDSTETETVSSANLADGETLDMNVAGTDPATDATVTLTGEGYTRTDSWSQAGVTDGQTTSLTVDGNLPPENAEVTFTGVGGTTAQTDSGSFSPGGTTESINIGGNLEPTGPASGGEPQVDVSGSTNSDSDTASTTIKVLSGESGSADLTYTNVDKIGEFTLEYVQYDNGVSTNFDVFLEGTKVGTATAESSSGEQTTFSGLNIDVPADDTVTLTIENTDSDGEVWVEGDDRPGPPAQSVTSPPPSSITVNANNGGSASLGTGGTAPLDLSTDTTELTWSASGGGSVDWTIDYTENTGSEDPSVDVDGDGSAEASHTGVLMNGETATSSVSGLGTGTRTVSTSLSSGSVDWTLSATERAGSEDPSIDVDGDGSPEVSHAGVLQEGQTATESVDDLPVGVGPASVSLTSGTVGASVTYTEHTVTQDPAVYVNGHGTSHSGELSPGQTTSLSTDPVWIQDGSNNVTVRVGDGSLSSDAPAPLVNMDYRHSAATQIDTTYAATGWEESYNVSHTFPGDQENAELRIPFSREIYDIEHVEQSVNGGSWESVPSEDWELRNGTELVVQLDDGDATAGVEAGDRIAVRTAGYKVQAVNGAITVVDPTKPGDANLDTGIRVDAKDPGFALEVGGTRLGHRVHHTHTESWENPDERVVVHADGSQRLYLPNAQTGGDARVTTIPLEVSPTSGDVGIQVADPDQPTIDVTPGKVGSGSEVEFTWYSVVSGEKYGLYSLPRERYLDKTDAGSSSVTLLDDDSEESLVIRQVDGSTDGGTTGDDFGGDFGGGSWDDPAEGIQVQEIAVLVSWAALVLGLVAATGRSDLRGRRRWILVASTAVGTGLLALELLRPGAVAGAVSSGLSDIIGLAGLAAIGIVVFSVVSWWQSRKKEAGTPETTVTLDLGRNK